MSEIRTGKGPKKTASTKVTSEKTETTGAAGTTVVTKSSTLSEDQSGLSQTGAGTISAKARKPRSKSSPFASIDGTVVPSEAERKKKPNHQEIALLAYSFFEQRGRLHGFHDHDWIRAEQELLMAS